MADVEIDKSAIEATKLLEQIELIKQSRVLDVAGHLLELSTSVNALQRNHGAMEQAVAAAFGEIAKGFRNEVNLLAKAVGVDLPALLKEQQQDAANTAGPQTPQ